MRRGLCVREVHAEVCPMIYGDSQKWVAAAKAKEKIDRNDEILSLVVDEGMRLKDVAPLYGLTPTRIGQIVHTSWERQIREGLRNDPRPEYGRAPNPRNLQHGHTNRREGRLSLSPEYHSWMAMKARCYNPNRKSYRWYGAKGIKVCERWQKFENFLFDMGPRPVKTTLDRLDYSKDYEPGNCRWATSAEQAANQRRGNQYLTAEERENA